jgi:cytochrome P450
LPAFRSNPLELYLDAARLRGEAATIRYGPTKTYFFHHPAAIKHILQDNSRNYARDEFTTGLFRLLAPNSLITLSGDEWLARRRLAQPAFHRKYLAALAGVMTDGAEQTLARWRQATAEGRTLDIAAEMMRLTLGVATRALFGVDVTGQAEAIGRAVTAGAEFFAYRSRTLFPPPLWLPTRRNRKYLHASAYLDQVVDEIIRRRRSTGQYGEDLLSLLLQAVDEESGEGLSGVEVRNEVRAMMVAGHETTANLLGWTLHLLSSHREAEEELHAELGEVLGGRNPTFDDLSRLRYTRMVLEESLRLFPPAWAMGRVALEDDEVGGFHVPAGTGITLSAYVTHRRPDFWPEPDRFDPTRFTPERSAGRPPFAFFPFGGGPRQCIGNSFAMTEATLVLATLAQRFTLRGVPGHPVVPEPIMTLRPKYGLPMVATARRRAPRRHAAEDLLATRVAPAR